MLANLSLGAMLRWLIAEMFLLHLLLSEIFTGLNLKSLLNLGRWSSSVARTWMYCYTPWWLSIAVYRLSTKTVQKNWYLTNLISSRTFAAFIRHWRQTCVLCSAVHVEKELTPEVGKKRRLNKSWVLWGGNRNLGCVWLFPWIFFHKKTNACM